MFCEVVGAFVVITLGPVYSKLVLVYAVTNPMESHIDGLRAFVTNASVVKPDRCCVVNFEGCGCLGVSKFFKGHSHGARLTRYKECCTYLCFHGGAHYVAHDFGKDMDRDIGFGGVELCGVCCEGVFGLVLGFVA